MIDMIIFDSFKQRRASQKPVKHKAPTLIKYDVLIFTTKAAFVTGLKGQCYNLCMSAAENQLPKLFEITPKFYFSNVSRQLLKYTTGLLLSVK